MKASSGTYALVFECAEAAAVDVGRLGIVELSPGFYIYIGSAFGPGGVKARVERHWRTDKRLHWHIDYLRQRLIPRSAWISYAKTPAEHRWACALAAIDSVVSVSGIGASDCRCPAHFFYSTGVPTAALFTRIAGRPIGSLPAPN